MNCIFCAQRQQWFDSIPFIKDEEFIGDLRITAIYYFVVNNYMLMVFMIIWLINDFELLVIKCYLLGNLEHSYSTVFHILSISVFTYKYYIMQWI